MSFPPPSTEQPSTARGTYLGFARVYVRSKSSHRAIVIGLGFFAAVGLAMLVLALIEDKPGRNSEVLAFIAAPFPVFTALGYWSARRFRVELYGDSIHIRGILHKTIQRSDVAGYRLDQEYNVLRLFGHNGSRLGSIDLDVETDPEFEHWFSDIPDLDARDFTEAVMAARQLDPSRPSPEQFVATLRRTQRFFGWALLGAIGVSLWFIFYPCPYVPLFLFHVLVFPAAVAACAAFPARVRFNTVQGWAGIDLMVLMASVALVARTLPDAHPFDWGRVALLALVPTLLLTAAVYRLATTNRLKAALGFSLFAACYSFGLVALGNQVFDREVPLTAEIRVVKLKGSPGDRSCTVVGEYEEGRSRSWDINCASLTHLQVGQWIRVDLFHGAFGIPWWRWTH